MRIRIGIVAVAAVAALAGGGCGDDEKDKPISKADLTSRVKKLCEQYQRERSVAEKPLSKLPSDPSKLSPATIKAVAPDIKRINDATREVVDDVDDLPNPKTDKDAFERARSAAKEGVGHLDEADRAAEKGDIRALTGAFDKVDRSLAKANEEGKEFGLNTCG